MPRWTSVAGLTLVWWALWGSWTALSLASGVAVALLVCVVFPLPDLGLRFGVRPIRLLVLVAHLAVDIVVATLDVARTTLRPPAPLRNAVVRVPLSCDSDVVLTVVAELVSLVPGSVVVEIDRTGRALFLHVLAVRSPADLDRVRDQVLAQERRVRAALRVREVAS